MTDLLALGVIVGMGLYGRRRGTLGMALLAGGLFGGYLAALLLFRPLGAILSSVLGIPGIIAYPIGGMLALFAVSAVTNRYAQSRRRERESKIEDGWEPTQNDGLGGMALGGMYGIAIAVIVSWASMSLAGLYGGRELSGVRESVMGRVSTGVVQRAVAVPTRAVVGDRFVASSVAHMVADPFKAIEGLNGVMADPEMQSLLSGGALQEAAVSQDPSLLTRNTSLVALAGNQEFAATMRTFGLLGEGTGAADPVELANAIIREAGPALRSVDALMADPAVTSVLEGSAFRDAWEGGDFMRLAQGDEFRGLFDRVLEELRRGR